MSSNLDLPGVQILTSSHNQTPNPGQWRQRAANMRALMSCMENAETKAIMAKLADNYDRLGDQAEDRARYKRPMVRKRKIERTHEDSR